MLKNRVPKYECLSKVVSSDDGEECRIGLHVYSEFLQVREAAGCGDERDGPDVFVG